MTALMSGNGLLRPYFLLPAEQNGLPKSMALIGSKNHQINGIFDLLLHPTP